MLESLFGFRARGDADGFAAHLAQDVVFFPAATWGHARFPLALRGREAVRSALAQRHINYVVAPPLIHRVLIDGDDVVVHRTSEARPRGGGPTQAFSSVVFLKLRNGLIAEWSEFCDGRAYDFIVNFPN